MPLKEKWILKCCEKTRRELEEKNEEIQRLKNEIEKIKEKTVIMNFKRELSDHNKRKICKECPPNKAGCKTCSDHFDLFVKVMVDEGFLTNMNQHMIKTDILKTKERISNIMARKVGYRPQW